jgi:hypothetical protein
MSPAFSPTRYKAQGKAWVIVIACYERHRSDSLPCCSRDKAIAECTAGSSQSCRSKRNFQLIHFSPIIRRVNCSRSAVTRVVGQLVHSATCACRKSDSAILVMKAAEDGL